MNNVNEQAFSVLLSPCITEKATKLNADRKYVFKVRKTATKKILAGAIEKMFDVKVEKVHVCNVKGKAKKFGSRIGARKGCKKAYVTLKEGYVINLGAA